jgi:hypothetical protein
MYAVLLPYAFTAEARCSTKPLKRLARPTGLALDQRLPVRLASANELTHVGSSFTKFTLRLPGKAGLSNFDHFNV